MPTGVKGVCVTDKSWKAAERHIGRLLGGTRVPVNGRGGSPDVEHPSLSIEVKYRASLPAWIGSAVEQAEASRRGGKLPVAVLHAGGDLYADALVVCRLGEFAEHLRRGEA